MRDEHKVEMMRMMREIKRISARRMAYVKEIYGSLEKRVSELAEKGKAKGLKGKSLEKYVAGEFNRMYSGKDTKKSKSKKAKEKSKKKSKAKK